jgi:hypothetical protein
MVCTYRVAQSDRVTVVARILAYLTAGPPTARVGARSRSKRSLDTGQSM